MASLLDTVDARPHDARGILMVEYPSGVHYNPVTVSQHALAYYDRWLALRADADAREVEKAADWLVDTQAPDGFWYYDFPNGLMPVPWVSGMAQGQGISILVRAHALTQAPAYLDAAKRALDTFERPSGAGGVRWTEGSNVYYEETMRPYSPHILNGMVFAMYGALDLDRVAGDARAARIFADGVATLTNNISRYDAGNWSYYNLADPPSLASRFYHGLHVQLLRELWLLTGRDVFREYSERFARYALSPPAEVTR